MKKLQDMSVDDFKKMITDINKNHRIEGLEIVPLHIHNPNPILYGFGGKSNGKLIACFEFKNLVNIVNVCDWLDYNGYERPKWTPEGITMQSTLHLGYEK